jgi:hypothetical protein
VFLGESRLIAATVLEEVGHRRHTFSCTVHNSTLTRDKRVQYVGHIVSHTVLRIEPLVATCSPKNRFNCRALLGLSAVALGTLPGGLCADAPTTVLLVDNGIPTAHASVEGTWTQGDGEIAGQGLASMIVGKQGVGPGDFLITTRLTVSEHPAVRAGLVIDEVADFGLSTPQVPSIYVRGFLFGDMTTPLKPLSNYGEPGAELTLMCQRVGDDLSLTINGEEVWKMTYESERPLGKIALRAPSAGTLAVREFRYEGTSVSNEGWVTPYNREHALLPGSVDVFVSGEGGYNTYRIPAIVRTLSGTLLAFCEGRKNSHSDAGDIDILLRRSFDGGKTWTPTQLVYEEGGTETITIGNPQPWWIARLERCGCSLPATTTGFLLGGR